MPTTGSSIPWASKAAFSVFWCNKNWLKIDKKLSVDNWLINFESNSNSSWFMKKALVTNILEDISKYYNYKFFETVQNFSINIKYLQANNEEEYFFEQVKNKETPLVLLKRFSNSKPYAYFENNNGIVYLLTVILTENAQKKLYCKFGNEWKDLSEKPEEKAPIKFREETLYVYTKINKEDLDKEKVNKILPSEWDGRIKESEKISELITADSSKKSQNNSSRLAEITKNIEIGSKIQKDLEIKQDSKQKIQNKEGKMQDYNNQIEYSKNEYDKLKEEIEKLKAEIKESENFIEIQKDLKQKLNNLKDYEVKFGNLKNENENLQIEVSKLSAELTTENKKNIETCEELRKSIEIQQDLKQKIQNNETTIKEYNDKHENLKTIINKLIGDIKTEKDKNFKITEELQNVNQNKEDMIKDYSDQLDDLKNEINKINDEFMTVKAKNIGIEEELTKSVEIQQNLKKLIENKEDIIKDQLKEFTNETNKLRADIKKLVGELEKYLEENKNLLTINAILQEENEKYTSNTQNFEERTLKVQNGSSNPALQAQIQPLKGDIESSSLSTLPRRRIPNYQLIFNQKKVGITNIGNTCYLNSLLQCFASNNEFFEAIQNLEYSLFSSLSSLLLSIRNSDSYHIEQLVRSFKRQLSIEFPHLGHYTQEDSKEVMLMLLGRLSDPDLLGVEIMDCMFSANYKRIFKCHVCGDKARSSEPEIFITVPGGKFRSIQEFLPSIRDPKYFIGKDKLSCSKCNKLQDITMDTEEIFWPSTVSFYLSSNNGKTKINEELDIEGCTYRWYGLICHYGTSQSGHYKAYTWDTKNWTEYNDSIVRNSSVDVANGYLAFYARV